MAVHRPQHELLMFSSILANYQRYSVSISDVAAFRSEARSSNIGLVFFSAVKPPRSKLNKIRSDLLPLHDLRQTVISRVEWVYFTT